MRFNPGIEAARLWTLRGNPALVEGRRLNKENAEFVHQGQKHGVLFWNLGDTHTEEDIIIPSAVKEAVHQAIEKSRICYTASEGEPRLVKSIAQRYDVPEGEVFVTNGVTEGIIFVARLFGQTVGNQKDALNLSKRRHWHNIITLRPVYPP
ncbi:MAG: hypothetical protein QME51_11205, partial [Planctomycetota bacterium]|nr:hypothetical protein [Planctomycetota bacterium]